jgi:hypothetical protein
VFFLYFLFQKISLVKNIFTMIFQSSFAIMSEIFFLGDCMLNYVFDYMPEKLKKFLTNEYDAFDNQSFWEPIPARRTCLSYEFFQVHAMDDSEEGLLQMIETNYLNLCGYIPIVGALSGICRLLLAIFDTAASIIFSILRFFDLIFQGNLEKNYGIGFPLSFVFLINSLCNLIRGLLEIIPGGGLMILYTWDQNNLRVPSW